MKGSTIAGGAIAAVLVLLAGVAGYRILDRPRPAADAAPAATAEEGAHQSFLYGRIATVDGDTFEGRLRWGKDEEAFWGNYFNGAKNENPWVAQVGPERLPKERDPIAIFGFEIVSRERPVDYSRLFMARFGDIASMEGRVRTVRVTLKSGTVFDLNRSGASDFDDGVRVWDPQRGVTDLDTLRIRSIELLPTPRPGTAPERLHGTVRTRQGDFTGFVQWDREECIGSDELRGRTAEGELRLRFNSIRSIAPRAGDSLVTLRDGRELVLSGTREASQGHRGVYVDDPRYGRVLVSWNAFEGIEFSPGGSGPAYGDFPPGGPLLGAVTTRAGQRLTGRLVFDLDESEVTETLDAPFEGVSYTLPFGLIASIVLPGADQAGTQAGTPLARVILHSREELLLERAGDLGKANAGMLIFASGGQRPEFVPWIDVAQVDLDRPAATYPPIGGR